MFAFLTFEQYGACNVALASLGRQRVLFRVAVEPIIRKRGSAILNSTYHLTNDVINREHFVLYFFFVLALVLNTYDNYRAFANSCPLQTYIFLFPLIHSHNVLLSSNKF